MARKLAVRPESAKHWLEDLSGRGLLSREGERYRRGPVAAGTATTLDELARTYASYRVAVVGLIFSTPSARVRAFGDGLRPRRP